MPLTFELYFHVGFLSLANYLTSFQTLSFMRPEAKPAPCPCIPTSVASTYLFTHHGATLSFSKIPITQIERLRTQKKEKQCPSSSVSCNVQLEARAPQTLVPSIGELSLRQTAPKGNQFTLYHKSDPSCFSEQLVCTMESILQLLSSGKPASLIWLVVHLCRWRANSPRSERWVDRRKRQMQTLCSSLHESPLPESLCVH